jgi:hypothetical protein
MKGTRAAESKREANAKARLSVPVGDMAPISDLLRQVWIQNYHRIDDVVRWRSSENIPPPSRYIGSPYDDEARLLQEAQHHVGRLQSASDRKL